MTDVRHPQPVGPAPAGSAQPVDDLALDLASAYGELQNLLLEAPELTELLQGIAELAAGVTREASCGMTMRRGAEMFTVSNSDSTAGQVDELQYGRGRGPCLEALHTGTEIVVADLGTEDRWGDYCAHALAHGVRSSLSIPLRADGSMVIGALNVYSRQVGPFAPDVVGKLRRFAGQAATAIRLALRRADQVQLEGQLREALATRAVIDQALGILMGERRIPAAEAFAALREASQNRNRKLHLVAADLIETVTGEPPAPARPFTDRR